MSDRILRIANGQGFWGDSPEAPVQLIEGGPLDYLTLDYLAEVTMSILQKQKRRDPSRGYATDFVELVRRVLPTAQKRGVRIVANAGGRQPGGLPRSPRRRGARGRRHGSQDRHGDGGRHPRKAGRAAGRRCLLRQHGRRTPADGDPRPRAVGQRLHPLLRHRRRATSGGADRRLRTDHGSRSRALAADRGVRLEAGPVGPARRGDRRRAHRRVRRPVHRRQLLPLVGGRGLGPAGLPRARGCPGRHLRRHQAGRTPADWSASTRSASSWSTRWASRRVT